MLTVTENPIRCLSTVPYAQGTFQNLPFPCRNLSMNRITKWGDQTKYILSAVEFITSQNCTELFAMTVFITDRSQGLFQIISETKWQHYFWRERPASSLLTGWAEWSWVCISLSSPVPWNQNASSQIQPPKSKLYPCCLFSRTKDKLYFFLKTRKPLHNV